MLGLANLSDGASATEVAGLVPSALGLRPADLLTRAAFGKMCALDVVIACPDSSGAGDDAAEAAVRGKLRKYDSVLGELQDEGVEYRPLAWTCWGRPHTDASAAIRTMSIAASRRHGDVDAVEFEKRAKGAIGVQIWRRAAQMAAACRPQSEADPALVLPRSTALACARLGRLPADHDDDGARCREASSDVGSPAVISGGNAAGSGPPTLGTLPSLRPPGHPLRLQAGDASAGVPGVGVSGIGFGAAGAVAPAAATQGGAPAMGLVPRSCGSGGGCRVGPEIS